MKRITKNLCRNKTKLASLSTGTAAVIGLSISFLNLTSCTVAPVSAPSIPTYSVDSNVPLATNVAKSKVVKISPTPLERPGLGTGWGKDIPSEIDFTDFKRASNKPSGVDTIYYNDKEGIKAMTNSWSYNGSGLQEAAGGLVEWGVKGSWGHLKNQHSKGKRFVTGNKGKNYALVVKNISHTSLEVVLSVDGIDVIDGKPASIKRRGYIIPSGEKLTIKGFRKSEDAVAAFKFASVNSSYTQLSGSGTRNIGVIGMAVFTEAGRDPWRYGKTELNNRNNARAFAEAPQLRAR